MSPAAVRARDQQPLLSCLSWIPGWPVAVVMDCQGSLAAIDCLARPLSVQRQSANSHASRFFQNAAYEGAEAEVLVYNAWRSETESVPASWWVPLSCSVHCASTQLNLPWLLFAITAAALPDLCASAFGSSLLDLV